MAIGYNSVIVSLVDFVWVVHDVLGVLPENTATEDNAILPCFIAMMPLLEHPKNHFLM